VHVGLGLEKDAKGKSKEVPNGDHHHAGPNGMDVEEGDTVETEFQHFTELRAVCMELKLEEEWRTIASITADRLVRRGEYGMAATMCLQAEDGYGLSRIAEKVVDAFVQHGGSICQTSDKSYQGECDR
jgi:nuclear pore complex protein Nup85